MPARAFHLPPSLATPAALPRSARWTASWRWARPVGLLCLGLLVLLAPGALEATSYIMPSDADLLAHASVVALGTIATRDNAPGVSRAMTDYQFEVERLVKGFLPTSTILVREPGGRRADGRVSRVYGAPRFRPGQRALLFLVPRPDGTFAVSGLALGAFFEVPVGDQRLLVRNLSELSAIASSGVPTGDVPLFERPRRSRAFVDWLVDRTRGVERPYDYFARPLSELSAVDLYQLTTSTTLPLDQNGCGASGGHYVIWQEFRDGQPVPLLARDDGQSGVPGGGFAELQAAMAAWNNDPKSNVQLSYAGTTTISSHATDEEDGHNIVQWNDVGDDIPGSFPEGGILAVTYTSYDCSLVSHRDTTAHPLYETDIVLQDGLENRFLDAAGSTPSIRLAELLAHELGHSIGLAHSCGLEAGPCDSPALDDALMRATFHDDNRGARLSGDDLEAVRYLYGDESEPPPPPDPPAAPSNLTAELLSSSEVDLQWQDNSINETGFEVQERTPTGDWTLLGTLEAGSTEVIVEQIEEGAARLYRVRAIGDSGKSAYSNEVTAVTTITPGPCVADTKTLCLNNQRFRLRAAWRSKTDAGQGDAVHLTNDTGYFWFFNAKNVELVVKALSGCTINSHNWVFAGALTNVQVAMTVSDMMSGDTVLYTNDLDTTFEPIQDTKAFATCP